MKAEIKKFSSPDIRNFEQFVPDEPERFGFILQIMAGLEGEPGEDSFDVWVCTPSWLNSKCEAQGILMGRHYLIVQRYDWRKIRSFIEGYVRTCEGVTWEDVAAQLGRLGHWEFEDYHEDSAERLTLFLPPSISLEPLRACMEAEGWVVHRSEHPTRALHVQNQQQGSYVNISPYNQESVLVSQYENDDTLDVEFREAVRGKLLLDVAFNALDLVKVTVTKVLELVEPELHTCWVDTEHGDVIRADQFLKALRSDPAFDWRHEDAD